MTAPFDPDVFDHTIFDVDLDGYVPGDLCTKRRVKPKAVRRTVKAAKERR